MTERNNNIVVEDWRRDLLAVKRAILDAEPEKAIRLLDEMADQLEPAESTMRTENIRF